jgi:hypothetical protein
LKGLKSTVDPSLTLLHSVTDLIETKEPEVLEIANWTPDFDAAALGALSLMTQIPMLINKLIPLEREVSQCTDPSEELFQQTMKEFISGITKHMTWVAELCREVESEVEFFGDNDFLGSPPYPNVDAFQKSWDLIKVEHPGKVSRAQRSAECYAFFVNISQFLSALQVLLFDPCCYVFVIMELKC